MTSGHVMVSDTVGRVMFAGMSKYFCWPPSVNKLFSPAMWEQARSACRDKMNNSRFHCTAKAWLLWFVHAMYYNPSFNRGP